MKTLSALVIDDGRPIVLGGLTLTERAILLADHAGLAVQVCGVRPLAPASDVRLRSRGVAVVRHPPGATLAPAGEDQGVVVIGPNVLFGPEVLAALAGPRADAGVGEAVAVHDADRPLLLYLPPAAAAALRTCSTIEEMAAGLAMRGGVRELPLAGRFCRRVDRPDLAAAAERDYVRHLTGAGESFFTKQIRRFSVPLTRRLVGIGATPTAVTLGGLALALASAWCLSRGSYTAGLLGAVLYYTSMVFDCSDGEVARLSLRDSRFGAWLETLVDYATYFLVLIALTVASQSRPGAGVYRTAALIALVSSAVFAIVAIYLRQRVAGADPGQFDDASSKALASSSRFHRFARWGRQWIKRSSLAHVLVALALVDQLPVLLVMWAIGATAATCVLLVVEPFVVRRVAVAPAGVQNVDARG